MEKDTDGDTWQAEEQRRNHTNTKKVSLLPLIFLIFYEVSGGPFGIEDSVRAGGPLLAILGFIVFPFIWSIPEALITAELATMLPSDAGYVGWISAAFGPYWGFQQGWWKWLSGVIDNALYPVLFLDYLKTLVPEVSSGMPRVFAIIIITIVLTYMNYRGLTVVGWVAVFLGIFSLIPFLVMMVLSVRHIKPSRWGGFSRKNVDWNLYLNTLFWNLNYWDSISTLTGEVDNPKKTMPKALFFALLLVVGCYLVPLMSATGALEVMRENWTDGYFSVAAGILGGHWLQLWIAVAAAFSNTGMFEAEMSSDAFMLLGMGEDGMLPKVFAGRSKHGTPLLGILCSASGVLLLSSLSFQEIVAAENYLYCLGMFAEFAAFVTLRIREPDMSRPYSVPLNTTGTVILCFVPSLLLIWVLVVASLKVTLISLGAVLIGLLLWPFLQILKKRKWVEFVSDADEDAGFLAGQHTV